MKLSFPLTFGVPSGSASLGANTYTGLQTINQATPNTAVLLASGHSLTGANAITGYSFLSTLNTTGANYDVFKIASTVTATGANTNLFAVYGGAAGATGLFKIASGGQALFSSGTSGAPGMAFNEETGAGIYYTSLALNFSVGGGIARVVSTGINLGTNKLTFGADIGTQSSIIIGPAVATLQQGAANAAAPVAQTLQSQGSRAGTDVDTGGSNYTVRSGAGTGVGTPSSLILQSYIAVGAGSGAQTATTGLTINKGTAVTAGYTVATLPAAPMTGARAHVTDATAPTYLGALVGGGAVTCPVVYNGAAWVSC